MPCSPLCSEVSVEQNLSVLQVTKGGCAYQSRVVAVDVIAALTYRNILRLKLKARLVQSYLASGASF